MYIAFLILGSWLLVLDARELMNKNNDKNNFETIQDYRKRLGNVLFNKIMIVFFTLSTSIYASFFMLSYILNNNPVVLIMGILFLLIAMIHEWATAKAIIENNDIEKSFARKINTPKVFISSTFVLFSLIFLWM